MKDFYQLINLQQLPSKLNGGFYWLAKFQNIRTQEIYESSIDPTMRNFPQWQELISISHKGVIVSGCNIVKRRGKDIIDADSPIAVEVACNKSEMDDALAVYRQSISPFGRLFQ